MNSMRKKYDKVMRKANGIVKGLTLSLMAVLLLHGKMTVLAESRTYEDDSCDLVATVEDGEDNDVYFAGGFSAGNQEGVAILFINTSKDVTVTMKSGVESTKDYIYIPCPKNSSDARHIILDNVVIDRSSEELFFQYSNLVNGGLQGEEQGALSAIYYPGEVVTDGSTGAKGYYGKLRLTLRGNNVLKGAKSSNSTESYGDIYTPSSDDVLAGIWAMNLGIDGDGTLEVLGTDYGIYAKRGLTVAGGAIKAIGSKDNIHCLSSKLYGGSYAEGGSDNVYGMSAYAGTVGGGAYDLCEVTANTDEDTKAEYPYSIRYTVSADKYLDSLIGRKALAALPNGEDYVRAYDMGLTCMDNYISGNSVSLDYGINYGFTMSSSMAIVNAIQNDHPEYWWLWINKTSAGTSGASIILENSYSYAKMLANSVKFENAVSDVLYSSGVCDPMTDHQKAYVLYQALAAHVSYDLSYIDQSANSAFVSGLAVCDGYAKAYIYLLRKCGIPATYVVGWGTPADNAAGGMHGWVMVSIDGKYYYCDPTWDGLGKTATFSYFMLGETDMAVRHEVMPDEMGYDLPSAESTTLGAPASVYEVTAQAGEGGVIYPGKIKVVAGSPLKITVIPDEGKSIETLSVVGTPVNAVDNEDGTYSYVITAINEDTAVNVTYKEGGVSSTRLTAVKSAITVKYGESVTGQVKLTKTSGDTLSGKKVSFSVVCTSDSSIQDMSFAGTTDENGIAAFNMENPAIGEYSVTASYGGEEGLRASKTTLTIAVLADSVYNAGDFVISRTGGGTLEEGTDYSYSEDSEVPGSGVLKIISATPMTITMSEAVPYSDDRIMIDAADSSAEISLTLSDVRIDRSDIAVTGSDAVYSGGDKNMLLTAAFSSVNATQKISIGMEGTNTLTGASTGKTIEEFAAMYNGKYTFSGSGELFINSEIYKGDNEKQIYSIKNYGINCREINLKQGNIVITADGEAGMSTLNGIKVDSAGTYRQTGGSVTIKNGRSITDAYSIYDNCGLVCSTFNMKHGTLDVSTCKSSSEKFETKLSNASSDSMREYYKKNHSGINTFSTEITGGTITSDGDIYGLLVTYNTTSSLVIKNAYVSLVGAYAKLQGAEGSDAADIISGYYNDGNVEEQTVYGYSVAEGSRLVKEEIDGVSWYHVKSSYVAGLTVTGGTEGIDYEYEEGALTLLTDTPMTIGMVEGVEAATDRIVSGSDSALSYNITFNNVNIDRREVTNEEVASYLSDNAVDIKKGNLNLTLVGTNKIQGSLQRTLDDSGFRCNNTGIYVEKGKLVVGGSGTLSITEPNTSYVSAGIMAGDMMIDSGNVDVMSGGENIGSYAIRLSTDYGNGDVTGSLIVNGGKIKAVIDGGDSRDSQKNNNGALCVDGGLTINDGEVIARMGDAAGASYGVLTGGSILVKKGSLSATSGKAGIFSSGIQCGSDFEIRGGEVTATGGCSGYNNWGYGLIVFGDLTASGGKLTVTGATGENGSSVGIYQVPSTGFVKLNGAEIIARGIDSANSSYGVNFNGHTIISAGKLTATGGRAASGDSVGIYNDTDSETVISGGEIIASGSDAMNWSIGIFQSSLAGGVDLKITGGTFDLSGGNIGDLGSNGVSSGMYVHNQLVIDGGLFKALGKTAPIDCNVATINGGSFKTGDVNAGTVYGLKVASGHKVSLGTNEAYPYTVVSNTSDGGNSGGTETPAGEDANKKAAQAVTDAINALPAASSVTVTDEDKINAARKAYDALDNKTLVDAAVLAKLTDAEKALAAAKEKASQDNGNNTDTKENAAPAVGTTEKDSTGKATYTVSETSTNESGSTVACVTYVAPTEAEKNASSVVIPDTVTLADGTVAQVTEIAADAFKKDTKLKSVTIGSNIETIGSNAFSGCSNITKVTIKGSSLKVVNDGAFANCKKLTKVTLGKNVTTIGKNVFSGDKKLKTVTINGNSVKKVGKNAFKGIKKNAKITVQAKDKKTYNKVVKMIKKSGAKNVKYSFKKKK